MTLALLFLTVMFTFIVAYGEHDKVSPATGDIITFEKLDVLLKSFSSTHQELVCLTPNQVKVNRYHTDKVGTPLAYFMRVMLVNEKDSGSTTLVTGKVLCMLSLN